MLALLLLAFIAVPVIELAVILQVGSWLGAWPTVAILVADSVAGAVLVRREGRRAWGAFRDALAGGRWPGDEVAQGALVLIGGALLLTPGFVTDVVGLLMVLPPTRALASRVIRWRITPQPLRDRRRGRGGQVIDVEVVSVERDQPGTGHDGSSTDDPVSRGAGDVSTT